MEKVRAHGERTFGRAEREWAGRLKLVVAAIEIAGEAYFDRPLFLAAGKIDGPREATDDRLPV